MASDENAGHDRFATVTIEEKPDTRQNRDHDPEKIPESEVQVQNNADGSPPVTSPPQHVDEADNSMPWPKLLLIAAGLWSGVFLHALDQTIVANAIPSITDEFHSLSDVGWYGSGYLLTMSAFQLFYGRVYANFSIKYTFLAAVSIFELGSLVCGLAPSSAALIVGRAVAGVGGAGIASGAFIIIGYSFPPRARPMFLASLGIVYAVASVCGPLLGGALTSRLTWRWCFYINLPFGGVTFAVILFFLPALGHPELASLPLVDKLKKIDLAGLLILIPAIVCLLLVLQWGGSAYPWSDGRVVALLVLFGVLGLAFLAFEYWKGADASLPIRIVAQRSVAAATWNAFCNVAAFLILVYYIPFWHQVIRGVSPVDSGIRLLPFVLGFVIMLNLSGALVSKFGYYAPLMILSTILTPIGEGLMTTWTVDAAFSQWVGYQALAGLGLGLGQQQPLIAVQAVLAKPDIPAGTSIILLVQTLSGAIFVSVGQSVLQNELAKTLQVAFPSGGSYGFDPSGLANVGATEVRDVVPPEHLRTVLVAYNAALTRVYTVALCMSALTVFGSLAIEWKSVKKAKK